ncbi:bifunctional phosphopantothenoylcysteine decarboxylase/phosphopantothenate--cysteine ligase CoaBC [Methanosarcinales archaeon]|nr:MAG: bifunctional phosphopantothenoylcysteine decarboxylase/phosphopantothenate--cysteine ligase CoaBC [Methanosarcinales archaeon]
MKRLGGKKIVVGVSGSIAAVKCVELIRELRRRGAEVFCVMSEEAQRIIHPNALEYASGNVVVCEIGGGVEHVSLCMECDLFLIARATANTISKIACGIADTPITTFATSFLKSPSSVLIAPAMHESMFQNPILAENIEKLKSLGVEFVNPVVGEGSAKLAPIPTIVLEVERAILRGELSGKKVVITAGATTEPIDPVRVITSRASGKTGIEIAFELYRRGADVVLISSVSPPFDIPFKFVHVESVEDMLNACLEECGKGCDLLICSAAVSDFVPSYFESKLSSDRELTIKLKPAKKVLAEVRKSFPDLPIVGFKAETHVSDEELEKEANHLKEKYSLLMVVANDVGRFRMGEDYNRVIILSDRRRIVEGAKEEVAYNVVSELVRLM